MRYKFTAEHRGEEFPDEWCVVDEDVEVSGNCVIYGVDESTAKALADLANYLYKDIRKAKTRGVS